MAFFNLVNGRHQTYDSKIDYFTKWVEAASNKSVTQVMEARFLEHNIICRYGIPGELITNNGKNLNVKMVKQLCQ